jgi:hypothetical protein
MLILSNFLSSGRNMIQKCRFALGLRSPFGGVVLLSPSQVERFSVQRSGLKSPELRNLKGFRIHRVGLSLKPKR